MTKFRYKVAKTGDPMTPWKVYDSESEQIMCVCLSRDQARAAARDLNDKNIFAIAV